MVAEKTLSSHQRAELRAVITRMRKTLKDLRNATDNGVYHNAIASVETLRAQVFDMLLAVRTPSKPPANKAFGDTRR